MRVLLLLLILFIGTINGVTFHYDVTPRLHWPLQPSIRWDLLVSLQSYSRDAVDADIASHWMPWMFTDAKQRSTIVDMLGGDGITSPLGTFTEKTPAILDIFVDIQPSSPSPWLRIHCQSGNIQQCQEHLLSLGHPDSDFPMGIGGYHLTVPSNDNDDSPGVSVLNLSNTSVLWHEHSFADMHLFSAAFLRNGIKLQYLRQSEMAEEVEGKNALYWHDRRDSLHYKNYLTYSVEYDEATASWCFDSPKEKEDGVKRSPTNVTIVTCRRICVSSSHHRHRIYTADLTNLGKSRLLLRLSHRYLLLHTPFDVLFDDNNGKDQCNKIVLNERLSRAIVHAFVIDSSGSGRLYLSGLSRQARDAIANDVHVSATPEIEVVRALWLLLIIPILTRRLVIPRRTLTETTVLAAKGEYNVERPIIPISHTMLNLDVGLVIACLVSVIWYIVAVYQSLPPQPNYPSYYIVAVFTAVAGLETLITTFFLQVITYEARWARCFTQSIARCFSCCLPTDTIEKIPYNLRPRAPTWLSMMNRNAGNMLGCFTLIYAMWWDTSDSYNWGLLVVFGMLACIFLIEHTALSIMVTFQLRSVGLGLYSLLVTAAFFLLFVFQLYDIWLPFFVTVAAGAYTQHNIEWILWAVSAGIVALIFSVAELPATRVKVVLAELQRKRSATAEKDAKNSLAEYEQRQRT